MGCPDCGVEPYACDYSGGKVRFAHPANGCRNQRMFIYPEDSNPDDEARMQKAWDVAISHRLSASTGSSANFRIWLPKHSGNGSALEKLGS